MAGGKMRKTRPKQGEGQQSNSPYQGGNTNHILKNPKLIDSIVKKLGIKPTDVVLEIGPGPGNLTEKLLEAAKSVVVYEIDPRTVVELNRRFQGTPFSTRLKIVQEDVLKCKLPYFDICVANIPYKISNPLTFNLVTHQPMFRCALIFFDGKYALSLEAKSGDNVLYTVYVSYQQSARVKHLFKVGLRPPLYKERDDLIHLCFTRKNWTLGSIFWQKSVLSLLEKKYKRVQALRIYESRLLEEDKLASGDVAALVKMVEDMSVEVVVGGGSGKDDDEMEMKDAQVSEGEQNKFKGMVLGVLSQGDFINKRASQLSQPDFMHLLSLFNNAGIHFW